MYNLNIVLAEPQIPQNTGNISRTCAVTGAKLHLIKPFGFDITYYENYEDFFNRNNGPYFYFTTKGKHVHSDVNYPDNAYIIFGREDKGLPEELLYNNEENCIRIPMRNNLRSLNLSNSVAIAAYEILRQWNYPDLSTEGQLTKYKW